MRRVTEAEVTLPNGSWQDGAFHPEARVRGLEEGEDVEVELNADLLPIERTTAVLARCVTHLASRACEGAGVFRDLCMGDREALLLHVRRMTFGERMDCLLSCPACASRMDFQLNTGTLLVTNAEQPQQQYEEEFPLDGMSFRVKFRVPRAGDVQDALASTGGIPRASVRDLVVRCVESVQLKAEATKEVPAAEWPRNLWLKSLHAWLHSILKPRLSCSFSARHADTRSRHFSTPPTSFSGNCESGNGGSMKRSTNSPFPTTGVRPTF